MLKKALWEAGKDNKKDSETLLQRGRHAGVRDACRLYETVFRKILCNFLHDGLNVILKHLGWGLGCIVHEKQYTVEWGA